jgi:FixJ family two-component response regulator
MVKRGTRIAVLDDDASIRKAMTRLFATTTYQATVYSSAAEFLAALNTQAPGCLVVDFQMPDMSGLELKRQLNQAGIRIPMIIITAHDAPELRGMCEKAGASAFLVKPISTAELLAAVEQAVGA